MDIIKMLCVILLQATQVRTMFPHYPQAVLIEDLRVTRSMEVTIDNILEGRLVLPPVSVAFSLPLAT